jgi:phosphotransferase system  glucose/maltose/N-acetylglucosamine-specific IIC component
MPPDVMMWEEFLTDPKASQHVANYGNVGLTSITVIMAIVALSLSPRPAWFWVWLLGLMAAVVADIAVVRESHRFKTTTPRKGRTGDAI